MDDNDLEFEFQQIMTFSGNKNKNSGQLVETKNGVLGRIYNHEDLINGKHQVHSIHGTKILCKPENLKLKGFID